MNHGEETEGYQSTDRVTERHKLQNERDFYFEEDEGKVRLEEEKRTESLSLQRVSRGMKMVEREEVDWPGRKRGRRGR